MKLKLLLALMLVGCSEDEKEPDDVLGNWPDDVVLEDTGQEDTAGSVIDTADTVDTDPVDGSQVASDFCNNCHVWNSPVWGGTVPEFPTVIPGLSETELADIIRNGTSDGMPSFSNLSQSELDALIVYLMETYN